MAANEMGMGEGTLTKAAGMVSTARQDFHKLSGELDGQINDLKGKWAGAGGQAFFILHQAWTDKQKLVVEALNEFEASLRRHREGRHQRRRHPGRQLRQLPEQALSPSAEQETQT